MRTGTSIAIAAPFVYDMHLFVNIYMLAIKDIYGSEYLRLFAQGIDWKAIQILFFEKQIPRSVH